MKKIFLLIINAFLILSPSSPTQAQTITEIIDETGDGTNDLVNPLGITVDGSGNVFVAGHTTNNAFKITPGGTITQIIEATGGGTGALLNPVGVAVDGAGNAYVGSLGTDDVFQITPGGTITRIIYSPINVNAPYRFTTDVSDNLYVTAVNSDNVWKRTTGGTLTEIIDATGDGTGNILDVPRSVVVHSSGNVYVSGGFSNNAFKITPGGTITEIIDNTGDGLGNSLSNPLGIAVDAAENVYVTGVNSNNVFKITPGGSIIEIIDAAGDGTGNTLGGPRNITVDASGNVYVTGANNAFKITPGGTITEIIDNTGDGAGNIFSSASDIAVDGSGNVYVVGQSSRNAFKITPAPLPVELVFFQGRSISSGNLLSWRTASESNNKGFEIQRSRDGLEWENLAFEAGYGNSVALQEYQFIDDRPILGFNYYRLKQIDFDEAFEYSKIISLEVEGSEQKLLVYPNPSLGNVNIQIDNPTKEKGKIVVHDYLGIKILECDLMEEESIWQKELQIERNGIYYLSAQIGNKIQYETIIVSDE